MVGRTDQIEILTTPLQRILGVVLVSAGALVATTDLQAQQLDTMALERWKVLREVERYQLNIAERYYKEKNWKVALGEYEKYLTLYEESEAASYAQLKWSLCLVQLRKANTAVKEGFQSVIDYWPESPEAVAAGYYIGRTYKEIGQVAKAKKAYRELLRKHPKHSVSVHALVDLVDITVIEDDLETRVGLWKTLTFDVARSDRNTQRLCANSASALASHYFSVAAFSDGIKALQTNHQGDLPATELIRHVLPQLDRLTRSNDTKATGDQLAERAVNWLRQQLPGNPLEEEKLKTAKELWYFIADVHAAARHESEVPDVYARINKTFGVDDETLGRLAAWYKYRQNQHERARSIYRQFQDRVAGLSQVAYSYREQRKTAEAVAVYSEILGLDPDESIRWKSEIAATYRKVGKYLEAIEVYRELRRLDTKRADQWQWQIATAFHEAKRYNEAIANYLKCSNPPSNYMQIALCHRAMKQYGEAILYYNQVMTGFEQSATEALFQIARTHEDSGKKETAIRTFQQVCKRYPKTRRASDAHAHLQNVYKISVTLGGAADK